MLGKLITTRGFTLIELLVTMSVVAILLAVAMPNYQIFVLNNRMSSQSNELLSAFQLARSEAIKRSTRVSVCKGVGGCVAGGTWAQGWTVFVDGDGVIGALDGTDQSIQVYPALTGTTLLGVTANANDFISYQPAGITSLAVGTTAVFTLCPGVAGVNGRNIQIVASGRASIANAVCP